MDRTEFLKQSVAVLLTPVLPNGQPLPTSTDPLNPGLPATSTTATTTIAVVGPLSGSDSAFGQQMVNGVRAALDDANRIRGNLDRVFAVQTFDDQDQPVQAALTASFAVNDGAVIGVIGHFSGLTTNGALRTYLQAQLPVVVPATSANIVTSHGFQNVFRLPTSDGAEGRIAARMLIPVGVNRCAIVHRDVDHGNDVALTFIEQARGSKIDVTEYVVPDTGIDPAALATTILAKQPGFIYLAGKVADLGALLSALRAASATVPLGASQGFFAFATTATYASVAEGLMVTTPIPPMSQVPADAQTIADFAAQYGQFTPVAGFAYSAAQVMVAAIRRVGAIDRPTLLRALGDGNAYQTIAGDFRFTPFGDQVDPNLYVYTVQKGAWRYARAYRPTPFNISQGAV